MNGATVNSPHGKVMIFVPGEKSSVSPAKVNGWILV